MCIFNYYGVIFLTPILKPITAKYFLTILELIL